MTPGGGRGGSVPLLCLCFEETVESDLLMEDLVFCFIRARSPPVELNFPDDPPEPDDPDRPDSEPPPVDEPQPPFKSACLPGPVTHSILFCRLFTIKDQCK